MNFPIDFHHYFISHRARIDNWRMFRFVYPLQIYPTDQSVSSYSSNPSTPVSSPPPLTGSGPGWAQSGAAPVSPHFTADPNRATIHMVWDFHLIIVNFFPRLFVFSLGKYRLRLTNMPRSYMETIISVP